MSVLAALPHAQGEGSPRVRESVVDLCRTSSALCAAAEALRGGPSPSPRLDMLVAAVTDLAEAIDALGRAEAATDRLVTASAALLTTDGAPLG